MLSVFGGEYSKRFSRSRKKWDLDYKAGMNCVKKEGISKGHFDVVKKIT